MPYIGKSPVTGNYNSLDDISGSFNSSTTTFNLLVNSGTALTPVRAEALIISINGVIQEPTTDFTVSAATITFTTAPASSDSFFGVVLGQQLDIAVPSDGSVGTAKIADGAVTMAKVGETVTIAKGGTGATAAAAAFTALAASAATIGSGAEEDTKLVFDGNAQDFHIGLDDTADSLAIGLGSALGTTDHMVFDAAGIIRKPLQSSFRAYAGGATLIESGSYIKIGFTSETYDTNADYTTGTSRFTAPVDGRYLFCVNLMGMDGFGTADGAYIVADLYVNNSHNSVIHRMKLDGNEDFADIYDTYGIGGNTIIKLDADDYVELFIYQNSTADCSMNYGVGYADWQGELLG